MTQVTHWRNRQTGAVRCQSYRCLPFSVRYERNPDRPWQWLWQGIYDDHGWTHCEVCGW